MLARDMLTGQLHEVPDYGAVPRMSSWPDPQTYGLGEVYDGLGNSLGMFFLPKLVNAITGGGGGGGAAGLLSRLLPGGGGGGAVAPPATRVTCPACPPCPSCNTNTMRPPMGPPGYPFPFPYAPGPARRRRRR
jgi:hypothetical protein